MPIVPAAVVYDLAEGDPRARPDADSGYAACEAAAPGVPERGRVGAGTGAAVGKILGRERSTPAGIGFAAARSGAGETVAALAVVNAFGDVIGEDGQVLGGCMADGDEPVRTAGRIAAMKGQPDWTRLEERNTTLVCVMTDATLDKAACTRVARMASGGVARAVDPVFSDVDGDVVFCLSSGSRRDRAVHPDRHRDDRRDRDGGGDPGLDPALAGLTVRPGGHLSRPMPGSYKTEAIVLRSIRYAEADRILHLYSATRGRINAIAKGSRRPRSRFGGRLEPYFRLDLVLHEGRGDLATVTSAATVAAHPDLRDNGPALMAAARGCDAVLRLCDSEEPNPAAYNLLCRYLALLDGAGAAQRGLTVPAGGWGRRPGDGAGVQAQAGARGRLQPRALILRSLR